MKTYVLIGAGNLATNLGCALQQIGYVCKQVYSRTETSAMELSHLLKCPHTTSLKSLEIADLYIFSVKDSVLETLIKGMGPVNRDALFVHTAGSMSIDVFKSHVLHYGVLYPLQTFSKHRILNFENIPCFIEGNTIYAESILLDLAKTLSHRIYKMTSDKRRYLHLAAVFACNFVNHCYACAERILDEVQIPFDALLPLIDETSQKVHEMSPKRAQTGPAVRYDENVLNSQKELLDGNETMKNFYDIISKNIYSLSQEK